MDYILDRALTTSNDLAYQYGTFGKYDWESTKKSKIIQGYEGTCIYDNIEQYGLRNGTLLSIAPAGTISTMCGISNGCEPLFMISYERTTHSLEKQGKYFKVYAKSVEDLLKHHGIDPESITVDEIKKRFPFVVDSHDITPEERVRTQAVMQKYVDNAISSTVNLKESATVQDIFDTYMLAWEQGLKGITVFRDGCKRGSILGGSGANPEPKKFNSISPVKRNNIRKMDGSTFVGHTACVKNLYTTVNKMGDDVFEVFTNVSTGCKSNINTITRLVSLTLRSGVKVDEVIHELKANTCPACTVLKGQGKNISSSCGNAIAEAIEEAYGTTEIDETLAVCPECGKRGLVPTGKCVSCNQCGYSKCD
jgi:ribonucleoside-diphosphate reductase alpha chain